MLSSWVHLRFKGLHPTFRYSTVLCFWVMEASLQPGERRALPTRLSPSRASDFKRCPKLFEYKTILGFVTPNTVATARGTLFHLVFEHLFDFPRTERTRENALSLVNPGWELLTHPDKADDEVIDTIERRLRDTSGLWIELLEADAWDLSSKLERAADYRLLAQPAPKKRRVSSARLSNSSTTTLKKTSNTFKTLIPMVERCTSKPSLGTSPCTATSTDLTFIAPRQAKIAGSLAITRQVNRRNLSMRVSHSLACGSMHCFSKKNAVFGPTNCALSTQALIGLPVWSMKWLMKHSRFGPRVRFYKFGMRSRPVMRKSTGQPRKPSSAIGATFSPCAQPSPQRRSDWLASKGSN